MKQKYKGDEDNKTRNEEGTRDGVSLPKGRVPRVLHNEVCVCIRERERCLLGKKQGQP